MVSPGPWPYPTAHPKKRLEWDTAQWNFRRPIGQKRSRVISKRQSRAIDMMMVRSRAVSTQNEMAARYLKSNESCLKSFRTWGERKILYASSNYSCNFRTKINWFVRFQEYWPLSVIKCDPWIFIFILYACVVSTCPKLKQTPTVQCWITIV